MAAVPAARRVLTRQLRTPLAFARPSSHFAALDAAVQANSPAGSPSAPRGPLLGHQTGRHSPIASTSSTLPPSITHTSAVAPADASLAGTPPLTPSPDAAPAKIPDPAKHDPDTELLGYLARLVMRDGKLLRAYKHINLMLNEIQLATNAPPVPALKKALESALTDKQRTRQAWKWIVDASDKRSADKEHEFGRRLALEVLAVLAGQSEAIKNYMSTHQQAVVNRANAR
ncbi:mitochondrial small subunit ribosomal protein S5e [Rhodotorula toruloides]|uniref:Mitochondrial small subunit ribosomal protein S5e n=1 Tax=Rhodotorula toruloides TaxID=5286 RepID=A0A511KG88_RHOTO|nr:mitochondrial small subunit ribosomal protein S5e [Rhodotorula toruloides]